MQDAINRQHAPESLLVVHGGDGANASQHHAPDGLAQSFLVAAHQWFPLPVCLVEKSLMRALALVRRLIRGDDRSLGSNKLSGLRILVYQPLEISGRQRI